MKLCVVREPWRAHPLAWIHRGEAAALAAELRATGHLVTLARLGAALPQGNLLLRLSDPVMLSAVRSLAVPYIGPRAATMEHCYDKYEACRTAAAHGVDVPATALATDSQHIAPPLVLKPRRGSDSLGLRFADRAPAAPNPQYIVQQRIHGADITVATLRGRAGAPLRILLPEGTPYTFARKYLLRTRRAPLADATVAARARELAGRIAAFFGSDWATRVDFILESGTRRLYFLECDVAPLIGNGSSFAASLSEAGISRAEQLRLLLEPAA